MTETTIMLVVLGLIDVVMISNLLSAMAIAAIDRILHPAHTPADKSH